MLVGFEMGLYSREDLATWVDAEVARRDRLPDPLLELTVLRCKHDVDIAALLRGLAGDVPGTDRATLELGTLRELVEDGHVPVRQAAYQALRIANAIGWDVYCEAIGLVDLFDLAEAGTYGSVEDAEREFLAFLDRYAL
jgi:hypothetical protein